MLKSELVRKTAKTSGLSKIMCDYITTVFIEHIKDSLAQGHDVILHEFGTFKLTWKTKFSGNLIYTVDGERYKAKPRPKLTFVPSNLLVNSLSHLKESDLVTHNHTLKYGKPHAHKQGKGALIYDVINRKQTKKK